MKRYISGVATFSLLLFSVGRVSVWAQTTSPTDDHTAREEAEGKEVWEKLQAKQLECKNLTDDNFEALGEYFMGQMLGSSHEAMNTMMGRMMARLPAPERSDGGQGEEGEEQMHVTMGKRMSGCDSDAPMPQRMMMNMMMGSAFVRQPTDFGGTRGGGNPMGYGSWNNMMGGWNGFGILGWLPMVLFLTLLILGVVALVRYLGGATRDGNKGRSPLDILKERYAKGEIDKKEFEQMKKDLT